MWEENKREKERWHCVRYSVFYVHHKSYETTGEWMFGVCVVWFTEQSWCRIGREISRQKSGLQSEWNQDVKRVFVWGAVFELDSLCNSV